MLFDEFDYSLVLKLRDEVASTSRGSFLDEHGVISSEFLNKLRSFRDNHSKAKNADEAFNNFLALWDFLGTEEGLHLLPPLYLDNPVLEHLLRHFVEHFRLRERGQTFQQGNIILGGVEGTGKTTLGKAMVLAVAICSNEYLLMYYDYKSCDAEHLPTVLHLCQELLYRLETRDFEGDFGSKSGVVSDEIKNLDLKRCMSMIRMKFNMGVGAVVDEVQTVITPCANPDLLKKRISVMTCLEYFARNCSRAFIVITGSSANLRSRLFAHSRSDHLADFPDFNNSLSEFFSVPALRDIGSLRKYLEKRYPVMAFTDEYVKDLLYCTGGIGRRVHVNVSTHLSRNVDLDNLFQCELTTSPSPLLIVLSCLAHEIPDSQFKSTGSRFAMRPATFSSCVGTSLNKVRRILEAYPVFAKSQDAIDKLVDKSLLYIHSPEGEELQVQLSLPILAEQSRNLPEPADMLSILCTAAMIYCDQQVNAGKCMEQFARTRMFRLDGAELMKPSSKKLCIVGDQLKYDSDVDIPSLMHLSAEGLLEWTCETGVDGVQFELNNKNVAHPTVIIDIWQNKGGFIGHAIGGGSVTTYRSKWLNDKKVDNIGDKFIAAVLVKAEVGVLKLANALVSTFPGTLVSFRNLVVTTTKIIGEVAMATLKSMKYEAQIPDAMIQSVNGPLMGSFSRLPYTIKCFRGDEWFRSIIEDNLQPFLPPLILKKSTSSSSSVCTIM